MRRNLLYGSLLSVVVAGIAAAQTTTSPTTAPGKTAPNPICRRIGGLLCRGAHQHGGHGQVREARSAHRLLVEADHDYDGHRARAAHEVHKALEELGARHAHATVPSTGASTPSTASSAASSVRHASATAPASTSGTLPPALRHASATCAGQHQRHPPRLSGTRRPPHRPAPAEPPRRRLPRPPGTWELVRRQCTNPKRDPTLNCARPGRSCGWCRASRVPAIPMRTSTWPRR